MLDAPLSGVALSVAIVARAVWERKEQQIGGGQKQKQRLT
jgi:hypothetical protein